MEKELWEQADRSGRVEVRLPCPHCAKRTSDKTLAINTAKRVGKCHRCQWTIGGDIPAHFSQQHIATLEKERAKREWLFNHIKANVRHAEKGDPVSLYLWRRLNTNLEPLPRLGYAEALRHYTGKDQYKSTPAMLGALRDVTGAVVGWHITHITLLGAKAFGGDSRRYCKLKPMAGSAIRLYPAESTLIVAEGIESALAWRVVTADPVWATTSASLLKSFEPPQGVRRLLIAGDNDANGVGQAAAWHLYRRFKNQMDCAVMIPDKENADWLDILRGDA
jgi:putative DNA primase/helicase